MQIYGIVKSLIGLSKEHLHQFTRHALPTEKFK